ncbi:MAG: hypothetical protein GKS06_05695 [Acidobacteria bacterium]|nr:hypothetical protein [Acidobacteriota bacterium]
MDAVKNDSDSTATRNNPGAHVTRRDAMKLGLAGVGATVVGSTMFPRNASGQITTQPGQIPTWRGVEVLDRGMELGPAPAVRFAAPAIEEVRIGFVGTGGMGTAHVRNLSRIEGCRITAVCDVDEANAERAASVIEEAGHPRPTLYTRGETDYLRLCEDEDLDLVYTATPWRWHVPVCLAAMENGKHAASEVPIAVTLEECWQLVEAAEKYNRHCIMMENVCYGAMEMMVLNLVRQGLLGELLHAECGYLHDLRGIKFADEGEGMWRRAHSMLRDGNLYPTHGLGPVAQCMNINRGDQFDYLVSMSSPSRGLQEFAEANYPEGDAKRRETFALGDVNTSLLKTMHGRSIKVVHDTNLPRPYSRINMLQGTRGIFQGYPDRVQVEGRSEGHGWEDAQEYMAEFEHPLWKQLREQSEGAGHGGMDFVEDWRLIHCLRAGIPYDIDVYDSAAWSAVSELSERSVAAGSAPVPFPDFTRGRWRQYEPLGIVTV